ncbi:MAG: hypothetical protein MUC96_36370, partial [Myxococcaceae bacterium]|nr:hypothetical protein [Myxococcaceae bacterium]
MTVLLGSLSSCCTEVGCNDAIVWQLPPTFPALAVLRRKGPRVEEILKTIPPSGLKFLKRIPPSLA